MTKKQKLNPRNELEILKNSISILDYAQEVLGLSPSFIGNGKHTLGAKGQDYDSCVIFPDNHFYRFSRQVGGDIIAFIQHFEDIDFKAALNRAREYYNEYNPELLDLKSLEQTKQDINTADPSLPERAENNKRVLAYLIKTRALDKNVVYEYIKRNLLYEEKEHHNVVWVGEMDGKAIYTSQRSTQDRKVFRRDSAFKEVGIYYKNPNTSRLILTEAVIDQMSVMSLIEEPDTYDYLSVNGVSNAVNALRLHLVRRVEAETVSDVICAFDNDEAGYEASDNVKAFLKENYPHIHVHEIYPDGKDFNQDLKDIRNGQEPYLISMQESFEQADLVEPEKHQGTQLLQFENESPYVSVPLSKAMIKDSYHDKKNNKEIKVMSFPSGHPLENYTFSIPAESFTLTQADNALLIMNIRKDLDIKLVSQTYDIHQGNYQIDDVRLLKGLEIADAYTNANYEYHSGEMLLFTAQQINTVKDTLIELTEAYSETLSDPLVQSRLEKRLLLFSEIAELQNERVSLSRSEYKHFEEAIRSKDYDHALSLMNSMSTTHQTSENLELFEIGGD